MKQFVKAAAIAGIGALGYFVEDPRARTADRFLADETNLNAADISRLNVDAQGMADVRAAVKAADWPRRVALQFGPVTPEKILADAERVKTVGGKPVRLIVVDYAQALANEGNMEQVCADTARALNVLASERGMATVFGSQVKTEV